MYVCMYVCVCVCVCSGGGLFVFLYVSVNVRVRKQNGSGCYYHGYVFISLSIYLCLCLCVCVRRREREEGRTCNLDVDNHVRDIFKKVRFCLLFLVVSKFDFVVFVICWDIPSPRSADSRSVRFMHVGGGDAVVAYQGGEVVVEKLYGKKKLLRRKT
eukprot:Rmarinus@m.13961